MTFKITHRTTYTYDDRVSLSYGQLHMIPRELPGQSCRSAVIRIEPRPDFYRERLDFFGNRVAYFEIRTAHRRLSVLSTSEVDVDGRRPPSSGSSPWEAVRGRLVDGAPAAALDARQFVLGSPLAAPSAALLNYALVSFPSGRPAHQALLELAHRVHDDFRYQPGATSVRTTAEEALETRAGVCQDFAHVMIGCLRSLGLAALYVSGYLETVPPPGRDRVPGADVSHAWASLWIPGDGWVDVDPTNRQFVNDRYTTTAWGRDYGDVPPLKGVVFTESAEHDLEVAVDVVRVPDG